MACFDIRGIAAAAVSILLLTAPHVATALTCDDVKSAVAPCVEYAQSGKGSPSAGCCSGVKNVNSKMATTADRQMTCNCLQNVAKTASFNSDAVASIPRKCGVNVPFAISTSTDCSKVT